MGQPLSRHLALVLDRDRLENSVIAPQLRKIFRGWNSTDLWTALRRYWNEYPKRPKFLSYADIRHIYATSLEEAELLFLWDNYSVPSNTVGLQAVNAKAERERQKLKQGLVIREGEEDDDEGGDGNGGGNSGSGPGASKADIQNLLSSGDNVLSTNDMFTIVALYCGASCNEKARFLLSLTDTVGRGLISIEDLHGLIFSVLENLSRACGGIAVKERQIRHLVDEFIGDVVDNNSGNLTGFDAMSKTIRDCKNTQQDVETQIISGSGSPISPSAQAGNTNYYKDRILGLIEISEICNAINTIIEASFISSHHAAIEHPKRKSPAMAMSRAPTRDFDSEALSKQPKDAQSVKPKPVMGLGLGGGVGGKKDETVLLKGGLSVGEEEQERLRLEEERKRLEIEYLQQLKMEKEFISITLKYPVVSDNENSSTPSDNNNPQLRRKVSKEIARSIGSTEARIICQYIGEGYIQLALGGKQLKGNIFEDRRTPIQLAAVLIEQFSNKNSALRTGIRRGRECGGGDKFIDNILRKASIYDGVGEVAKYLDSSSIDTGGNGGNTMEIFSQYSSTNMNMNNYDPLNTINIPIRIPQHMKNVLLEGSGSSSCEEETQTQTMNDDVTMNSKGSTVKGESLPEWMGKDIAT